MRKRKATKKPRYSAKPGQSETAQAKDYTKPKISIDLNSEPPKTIYEIETKNPWGWTEKTTVKETAAGEYLVTMEMQGDLYLVPASGENTEILSYKPEPEDIDDSDDESSFEPCDNCDLPDACSDYEQCAIKSGLRKNYPIDGIF